MVSISSINKQIQSPDILASECVMLMKATKMVMFLLKKKKNIFGFTSFTLHCEIQRHKCVAMERTLVA